METSFLENLENSAPDVEQHVKVFVIPNNLRNEILEGLSYLNISRATLFPGLDGFAQSLRCVLVNDLLSATEQQLECQTLMRLLKYNKEYERIFGTPERPAGAE